MQIEAQAVNDLSAEHQKQVEAVDHLEDVIKELWITQELESIHEEAVRLGCSAEEVVTAQKYSGCLFLGNCRGVYEY